MKNKIKKILLLLLSCLLVGCQAEGTHDIKDGKTVIKEKENVVEVKGEPKEVAMGRYIEQITPIDELVEPDNNIILWQNAEGKMEILVQDETFKNYEYKEDGTYEESEAWLVSLLNDTAHDVGCVQQILYDEGEYYLLADKANKKDVDSFIIRCNETNFEEIHMEWQTDTPIIAKIAITSDKKLVACDLSKTRADVYSSEGKFIEQIGERTGKPVKVGDKLVFLGENKVEIYNERSFECEKTINGITCNPRTDQIISLDGERAYLACSSGIFKYTKGAEVLEKILEESLCSLSSDYIGEMIVHNDEIYISLIRYDKSDRSISHIRKYSYREDIPTTPQQEIVIWTPTSSRILKEAVAVYKDRHPEAYVKIQTLYNDEQWWQNGHQVLLEDYEALNTQLLAGEGPDLFILDELPIESYRKSGILADLSGCVAKSKEENTYIDNVLESYKDGEKIYAVPLVFSLCYGIGKQELLEGGYSFDKMVANQKAHPEKFVQMPMAPEIRTRYMADFMKDQLFNPDGRVKREAMKTYLENIKETMPTMTEPWKPEYWKTWNTVTDCLIGDVVKADIEKASWVGDLQCAAHLIHEKPDLMITNKIEGVENYLIGYDLVGINQNSPNKEAAEEIINIALSTTVQGGRPNELPVNIVALEDDLLHNNYREMNKMSGMKYILNDKGDIDYDFEFGYQEEMQMFLEMCKHGTVLRPLDMEISEILAKETEGYFEDRLGSEETLDQLESKIDLYLSEQERE